ncbi:COG4705 family protein [Kitasatospora sp. McL0602]|uniref:COG4705 family protein n=1 Tax=Kitasatospora sp. McL0602 TaxID=3439530 RepID=UPI003F8A5823
MTTGITGAAGQTGTTHPPRTAARQTVSSLSKVPEVTAWFWLVKVLTTGMGETTSDYLANKLLTPVVAVGLAGVALVVVLGVQLSTKKYVAWIYWLAVVMVSVFGTMAADVLHVGLGVPYAVSTAAFVVALAGVLGLWYLSERTLSIHSVRTRRRELFYWATVMGTFALGTAAGDLTAVTMHLGYFSSGLLFAALIAVPALAHWKLRMNAILAFWFAYIVTRPLGASFADWAGVPTVRGGLGLGTGPVSLALAVVILALVGYLTVSRKDVAAGS